MSETVLGVICRGTFPGPMTFPGYKKWLAEQNKSKFRFKSIFC